MNEWSWKTIPSLSLTVALIVQHAPCVHAALFTGIGDLPGGKYQSGWINFSESVAISSDGSVVVGMSHSDLGYEAFRWAPSSGINGIGNPPSAAPFDTWHSHAWDLSGNGTVIVGSLSRVPGGGSGFDAYRWEPGTTEMQILGVLSPEHSSSARAVSDDGTVIVGNSDGRAFKWTQQDDIVDLGSPPGKEDWDHSAWAVSGDGSIISGESRNPSFPERLMWRLTDEEGFVVGSLPDSSWYGVEDITPDGSVIVGFGGTAGGELNHLQPFRWTRSGISRLEGWDDELFEPNIQRVAVSDDGTVIVGSSPRSTPSQQEASFIWDEDHGVRDLREVLI